MNSIFINEMSTIVDEVDENNDKTAKNLAETILAQTSEIKNESEIKRNLEYFLDKNKQNNILEIGCYEGMSSTFFADNF